MTFFIGLDLGSSTVKAVLYALEEGRVAATASRPTPVSHPRPDWSEHDPQELWRVACAVLREIGQAAHEASTTGRSAGVTGLGLNIAGRSASPTGQSAGSESSFFDIAGLGVSSFAEAGLPLDAGGQALYPIIAWYDRRCSEQAARWEQDYTPAQLHAITGQRSSTSFAANKWLWLRENIPGLAERTACWLSAPDYLLWKLTGSVPATDHSLASRTLLFDQRSRDWSPELLARVGLRRDQLPQALPAGTPAGKITHAAAMECGLQAGTLCVLGGHDHLCASLAGGAVRPGAVIDSTGTAEALVLVLPAFQTSARLAEETFACYAHVARGQYVLKGGLRAAGAGVEWLARILSGEDGSVQYAEIEAEAWQGIGRRAGPLWLPDFWGAGSPIGDLRSRAALAGVKLGHNRGDVFRGLLEGMAFWTRQNLEEMESLSRQAPGTVALMGGGTRLDLLSQLKADVLNRAVEIPQLGESAALGAALLAGIGAGAFAGPEQAFASLRVPVRVMQPDPGRADWYDRLYHRLYLPLYSSLLQLHHTMADLEEE